MGTFNSRLETCGRLGCDALRHVTDVIQEVTAQHVRLAALSITRGSSLALMWLVTAVVLRAALSWILVLPAAITTPQVWEVNGPLDLIPLTVLPVLGPATASTLTIIAWFLSGLIFRRALWTPSRLFLPFTVQMLIVNGIFTWISKLNDPELSIPFVLWINFVIPILVIGLVLNPIAVHVRFADVLIAWLVVISSGSLMVILAAIRSSGLSETWNVLAGVSPQWIDVGAWALTMGFWPTHADAVADWLGDLSVDTQAAVPFAFLELIGWVLVSYLVLIFGVLVLLRSLAISPMRRLSSGIYVLAAIVFAMAVIAASIGISTAHLPGALVAGIFVAGALGLLWAQGSLNRTNQRTRAEY